MGKIKYWVAWDNIEHKFISNTQKSHPRTLYINKLVADGMWLMNLN